MGLFPHDNLDYTLRRLEQRAAGLPDDPGVRLELAAACLSRAAFHDGGAAWFDLALAHARRALLFEPDLAQAHVIAGVALLGLDRDGPARVHLDQVRGVRLPEVHYARSLWFHEAAPPGADPEEALAEAEAACRLAPDAWEPHALLAVLLWQQSGAAPGRALERCQYACVHALTLRPPPHHDASLRYLLALACRAGGRLEAAAQLLGRVAEHEALEVDATYELAVAHYEQLRPRNAYATLRRHLERAPESRRGWTLLAKVHLDLGDPVRSEVSARRALALDPSDIEARWVCARVAAEDGRPDDARVQYAAILADAPDHLPSFEDLAELEAAGPNALDWLEGALAADVTHWADLDEGQREPARARIAHLVRTLRESAPEEAVDALFAVADRTTNDDLADALRRAAEDHDAKMRADALLPALRASGQGETLGREVFAVAAYIPAPHLAEGLSRARADGGPQAQVWRGWLLRALGANGAPEARAALAQATDDPDPALAEIARDALAALDRAPRAWPVSALDGDGPPCATCGTDAAWRVVGGQGGALALCEPCATRIDEVARDLRVTDPTATCALSGRTQGEARALYRWRDLVVSAEVVALAVGAAERGAVDRWLG